MISIEPTEETGPETLVHELALNEVLTRFATEMRQLKAEVVNLESSFLSNPEILLDDDVREKVQSIDLIQQSLQALADSMSSIAKQPCGRITLMEDALSEIHLGAMRRRLGRLE